MNNNNDDENNVSLNLNENHRDITRLAFIRALTSVLNGDNVRLLPLSGSNNNLRQILRQSLYDKNPRNGLTSYEWYLAAIEALIMAGWSEKEALLLHTEMIGNVS